METTTERGRTEAMGNLVDGVTREVRGREGRGKVNENKGIRHLLSVFISFFFHDLFPRLCGFLWGREV
jgi:hypothetical protein